MNPVEGAEYIFVLSGFNLDLSPLLLSPSLCQHFEKAQPEFFYWRDPLVLRLLLLYFIGSERKSLYKHFSCVFSCAEPTEYVDVICSTNQLYEFTPLNFTSTPGVYDTWHFMWIFVVIKSGYISGCWQFGPAAPLAVTGRVCCLFVLAAPVSLFICTLWVFWHDCSQWRKAFQLLIQEECAF